MKTVLRMSNLHESETETPTTLPAHAALIPHAARLDGMPHKGWYFAVMVRAAYSRLAEGA
jgi:hypothetical protein